MSAVKNLEMLSNDTHNPQKIIENGNIGELNLFLKNTGITINTPIQVAVHQDYVEKCLLHIAVDVNPNVYHPDLVKYLLSQGADCNRFDGEGYTPLHRAVMKSNLPAAEALLGAGADVNCQVNPPPPSFERAFCGFARGQIISAWWMKKTFPLHLAVLCDHSVQRRFPYNYAFVPVHGHEMARTRDPQLIKLLLSYGADLNRLDGQGLAALHYAARHDDVTVVELLLDSGANINIKSENENMTPLFCALTENVLEVLLQRKADTDITAYNGDTLLHYFICSKLHKLTRLLLSDTCPALDVQNQAHISPLAVAISMKDEQTIRLLIGAGCDPGPEVSKVNDRRSWIYTAEGEALMETMGHIASNPRRLFDLCRFKIRKMIKKNIRSSADGLPLPRKLKEAICLKDVIRTLPS